MLPTEHDGCTKLLAAVLADLVSVTILPMCVTI